MPNYPDLRIAVVGAGSTGGLLAGLLTKKGYQISLVTGRSEYTDILLLQGITLGEGTVRERIHVPVITHPGGFYEPPDIVFLCVKGFDISEAARALAGSVQSGTAIVIFQPIIYEAAVKKAIPRGKLISGIMEWSSLREDRFAYTRTSGGSFYLGPVRDALPPVISTAGNILSETGENYTIDNGIESMKWGKFIVDAVLNAFGLILGCTFGEFLSERDIRRKAIEAMGETAGVIRSLGKTPAGFASLNFRPFKPRRSTVENLDCHIMLRNYGLAHRNRISTDLQALRRGGKSETAELLSFVIREAGSAGISIPAVERLYGEHQEIFSGNSVPSLRKIQKI